MSSPGIVYLVGAGPGDLGLVTFRAKELISRADVLVYDYLVHPELVAWCKVGCEVLYVGKQAGRHSVPQEEIEALLVRHAKAGKVVVRLKGGDPFVFGRGGEEARTLAKGGVRFEVVPGVTAALAAGAYAGIPLTHRNTSSSLIFLTGHEDPKKHELQVDWRAYGALKNATLAIYMGMGHLRHILSELVAGGLPASTPAAAVQWASLGRHQRVSEGIRGGELWHALDLQVKLLDFAAGGIAHAGKAQHAEVADLIVSLEEVGEERAHAVTTGEDNPVVAAELGENVDELFAGDFGHDTDERELDHLGAERLQLVAEIAGLLARARDRDAAAEERKLFEPVDLLVLRHDLTHNHNGRCGQPGMHHLVG